LNRIGTGWLLPGSGLAAVTRLCPCGGARGRVQYLAAKWRRGRDSGDIKEKWSTPSEESLKRVEYQQGKDNL